MRIKSIISAMSIPLPLRTGYSAERVLRDCNIDGLSELVYIGFARGGGGGART